MILHTRASCNIPKNKYSNSFDHVFSTETNIKLWKKLTPQKQKSSKQFI
jgi:hypothetical protein